MYKYKRFYEIYDHQLLKTRALKRVKPGLYVHLDPSKAQVKTRVLDGLEFSKNQQPWVFRFLRLRSSTADDRKFRKNYYICTFKISGTIFSVKFDQRYESTYYANNVSTLSSNFRIHISLSQLICLQSFCYGEKAFWAISNWSNQNQF